MKKLGYLAAVAVASSLAWGTAGAQTLRWASEGDPLTMDPHSSSTGPTIAAQSQIYEGLVLRDVDLKKIPGLAESWKIVDPTTWEFKLRQGVKFHDGQDFTAEDVVYSLMRAKGPGSDFKPRVASIADVIAIDDYTVQIKTDGPDPILSDWLTGIMIMDKGWSEEHGVLEATDYSKGAESYAVRHANGTGPYMLESRESDIRTVMVKNPDYWGKDEFPLGIERIEYTPIAQDSTRTAALLSGELQFVLDPPVQDIERIRNTPGFKVEQTNQVRSIFFGVDVASDELQYSDVKGKNPFKDKRVREAVYRAIDIEAIKDKVMRGLSVPAGAIIAPGVHGYNEPLDERLPYDPEGAKKLLAEAGYPDGFGVTLHCPNDRYINDEAICQAAVAMLGRVGIDVRLESNPKSIHFKKLLNRDTSFYLLGWGMPTNDSEYAFRFLLHTPDGTQGSWNFARYSNAEVDKLIAEIQNQIDLDKRDEAIQKVWDIVQADMVYIPLHHQIISWAMSENLDLPIRADDAPLFMYARMKE